MSILYLQPSDEINVAAPNSHIKLGPLQTSLTKLKSSDSKSDIWSFEQLSKDDNITVHYNEHYIIGQWRTLIITSFARAKPINKIDYTIKWYNNDVMIQSRS